MTATVAAEEYLTHKGVSKSSDQSLYEELATAFIAGYDWGWENDMKSVVRQSETWHHQYMRLKDVIENKDERIKRLEEEIAEILEK